ncbi:MAG: 16S rRNA (guanine(527)-N(7))-methyltransferase RsmG [Paracoccus sp. (in: a-proteobacteria)]|nr:16S rRNA (guanine(527)-N(7))-methyltransferase RsmG [Paracoccus sp. (in: a-proteobacteria)]
MNVSRETEGRLRDYASLVRKWNPSINLVAPATLADFEQRHIADSAQLFDLAQPKSGSWMDLGSGGGLPGVVLSILTQNSPLTITLVESDKRKSAFLNTVRRALDLSNLIIKPQRIESLARGEHQFLSARALAPLDQLLLHLDRQLASDGVAWLLKGRSWRAEVDAARKQWRFDLESHQSQTDPEAAILKLWKIEQDD